MVGGDSYEVHHRNVDRNVDQNVDLPCPAATAWSRRRRTSWCSARDTSSPSGWRTGTCWVLSCAPTTFLVIRYEQLKAFTARTEVLKLTFTDVRALFDYCCDEQRSAPTAHLAEARAVLSVFIMPDNVPFVIPNARGQCHPHIVQLAARIDALIVGFRRKAFVKLSTRRCARRRHAYAHALSYVHSYTVETLRNTDTANS